VVCVCVCVCLSYLYTCHKVLVCLTPFLQETHTVEQNATHNVTVPCQQDCNMDWEMAGSFYVVASKEFPEFAGVIYSNFWLPGHCPLRAHPWRWNCEQRNVYRHPYLSIIVGLLFFYLTLSGRGPNEAPPKKGRISSWLSPPWHY